MLWHPNAQSASKRFDPSRVIYASLMNPFLASNSSRQPGPRHLPASRIILREELIPGALRIRDVRPMNRSRISGAGPIEITTPPEQWAFAAGFKYRRRAVREIQSEVVAIRVTAKVLAGRVGIGCVARDLRSYISTERDWTPDEGLVAKEFLMEPSDSRDSGLLVVRNTAEGNRPSVVTVTSIQTFRTGIARIPDLVETEPISIRLDANAESRLELPMRKFRVLLTHTSREWDRLRCDRDALVRRFSAPARLLSLPPFETLAPPPAHLYSGSLSILDLLIDSDRPRVTAQRYIESELNIQHATFVNDRLVLCFENFLAVMPSIDTPLDDVDLRAGSPWRIDDNWFSGLHTVFPVSRDTCLVSSAGSDAALWVDLERREVVRRWRLPPEIYGRNYDLTPAMAVNRHYIHNDIQLGHLNCAYPDGEGGCYISTLAQGDIGHVSQDGSYSLLARGYVGCHGVRLAQNGASVYFSDSCSGRLMELKPDGEITAKWSVDSRWLHDVVQADSDFYLFCLGDRNQLAVVDSTRGQELCRFAFDSRGANVQFISVTSIDT
jgi:hypothetical protein